MIHKSSQLNVISCIVLWLICLTSDTIIIIYHVSNLMYVYFLSEVFVINTG